MQALHAATGRSSLAFRSRDTMCAVEVDHNLTMVFLAFLVGVSPPLIQILNATRP